jgi:nucleotide-binding universal stress UspA family protein
MYPWRRILIPTDFSTAARWAFDNAIHLAGGTAAELVILHVRMTRVSHPEELRFPADPGIYDYAERVELAALRERAGELNASVATRLLVRQAPDPGNDIARAAKAEEADLVVIATHARHHVAHLIIGSTTLAVVNDPPAPVLAVRYGTTRRRHMRRLVVPVHPQQTSRSAAALAGAIAAHEGGKVDLIVVCDTADRTAAQESAAAVAAALGEAKHEIHLIEGDDAEREILRHARRADADVIVVNSGIGDVKRAIIRNAESPVMIVP